MGKETLTRREFLKGAGAALAAGVLLSKRVSPQLGEQPILPPTEEPTLISPEGDLGVNKVGSSCSGALITGWNQLTDRQIAQHDRLESVWWGYLVSWTNRGFITGYIINRERNEGVSKEIVVDKDGNLHLLTRLIDPNSPLDGAILLPQQGIDFIQDPNKDPWDLENDYGDPIFVLPATKNGRVVYLCEHNTFANQEEEKNTHIYDLESHSWKALKS